MKHKHRKKLKKKLRFVKKRYGSYKKKIGKHAKHMKPYVKRATTVSNNILKNLENIGF